MVFSTHSRMALRPTHVWHCVPACPLPEGGGEESVPVLDVVHLAQAPQVATAARLGVVVPLYPG